IEVAGRHRIAEPMTIRANYTWTDSERLSGSDAGLPLTEAARHMFNATLDWTISEHFSMQLIGEARSKRYRGQVDDAGNPMYYGDYEVFHLAAQYRFNDNVAVSARINNLLDEDFTSFATRFVDNGDGTWTPQYLDDYNNKDKARNLWMSLNVRF